MKLTLPYGKSTTSTAVKKLGLRRILFAQLLFPVSQSSEHQE
jgi:hypothetical protein